MVKLISKGAEAESQVVNLSSVLNNSQTSIDKESLEQILHAQSHRNSDSSTTTMGFLQTVQGSKERTLHQSDIPCKSYKYPDKNIQSSAASDNVSRRFCKYVVSQS